MAFDPEKLDESEKPFIEHFEMIEKAKAVSSSIPNDIRKLIVEYMKLTESYEKLLKTTIRISKMGDKAQKKLIKYKELMDTLRNIE
ncbi:MAG: hypothetical protein FMNOHCHN_01332 [Ignavibacteriaceae bacterium]|nr:hypothetical protein [Ignavibacteriaceae bacterium]MCK6615726.1 hypothetical protein [Ignavibacteriaceae bacterium]